VSQNEESTKKANRAKQKKQIAVWNRRLAWVTLPMLLISTFAVYASRDWMTNLKNFGVWSSMVFILCLFVHSFFSVYLFGFPRFKWQVRVVHIYIGYAVFIFTIISQSIIGFNPYYTIFYVMMWIFIIAHISLSTRFMLKRNVKKKPEPELFFRSE
jgi:hypothetical protein